MAVTCKDKKTIYAPARGQLQELEAVWSFDDDGGAADTYIVFESGEEYVIHSFVTVITEDLAGSGDVSLVLGDSFVSITNARAVSVMTAGSSLKPVTFEPNYMYGILVEDEAPIYTPKVSTPSVDLDEGFETVFPTALDQLVDIRIKFTDTVTGGKIKVKALVGKKY